MARKKADDPKAKIVAEAKATLDLPPVEDLREQIDYDPVTGTLFSKKYGRFLGSKMPKGYIAVGFKGKKYLAHRLAWALVHGSCPKESCIDHINGKPDDNRIDNLRLASVKENSRNQRLKSTSTSGYKGACFDKKKGKWMSHITVEGKFKFLGYHPSAESAHLAYIEAAKRNFGEFLRAA